MLECLQPSSLVGTKLEEVSEQRWQNLFTRAEYLDIVTSINRAFCAHFDYWKFFVEESAHDVLRLAGQQGRPHEEETVGVLNVAHHCFLAIELL